MKTKLLTALVAFICAIVCAFSFVACGGGTDNGGNGGNGDNGGNTGTTDKTVAVTEVALNKSSITLEIGGTETLTAIVKPDNATNKTVSWKSSADGVATVSNGKVTAVAEGTAIITATAGGKSGTCAVTVNNKAGEGSEKPDPEIPEKYTVTFQPNGGTFENGGSAYSVSVNEGEKVSAVTVTRETYQFLGWYIDEEHTVLFDFDSRITKSTTLYAGWKYVNPYKPVIEALQKKLEKITANDGTQIYKNAEIINIFELDGFLCFVAVDDERCVNFIVDIEVGTSIENVLEIDSATLLQAETFDVRSVKKATCTVGENDEETKTVNAVLGKILGDSYSVIWGNLSNEKGYESINVSGRIGRYSSFDVSALVVKDGKIFDFSAKVNVIKDDESNKTPYECILNGECDKSFADWGNNYKAECAFYTTFEKFAGTNYGEEFENQPYMLKNLGVIGADFYAEWKKEQEANKNTADARQP